jgi:arylsulfatase A-like enzyme
LGRGDIRRLRELHRNQTRSLQAVDEAVGAIIDLLDQQGELDNTYIVFTSDNGFHMGEHRYAIGKAAPYEESAGVPLVVRGPGVEKGGLRDHMVTNNDFAPTFAAIGGAEAPDFVDGKSFEGLLGAMPPSASDWRTAILIERLWSPGDPPRAEIMPKYAALRTQNHLYVEYSTNKEGANEKELYDLRKDPYQLRSRHATASQALITRFEARLEALRSCAGEECRAAEEGRPAG